MGVGIVDWLGGFLICWDWTPNSALWHDDQMPWGHPSTAPYSHSAWSPGAVDSGSSLAEVAPCKPHWKALIKRAVAHLYLVHLSETLAQVHAAVIQLPWRTCIFLAFLLLLQAELQKRMSLLLGNINITERCSFSPSMMIITKDMQEDFITEHCPS